MSEEKSQLSDFQFEFSHDQSPLTILLLDEENLVYDLLTTKRPIYPISKQLILGKHFRFLLAEFVNKKSLPEVENKILKLIIDPKKQTLELRTKNSSDTLFTIFMRFFPLKQHNPPLNMLIIQDITKERTFHKKLEESEAKFRTIAEQSLVGIGILQDDLIKYINQKYAEMFGYSVDEILSWAPKEYLKTVHPEEQAKIKKQAALRQKDGKEAFYHYESRGIKKSGQVIWVEIFSTTISFQGRPADFFTMFDITDKKNAETKLQESEEKFRKIAEQTIMGVGILQEDRIIYTNDALSKISGYTKDEIQNWTLNEFKKKIHPNDLPIVEKELQKKFEYKEQGGSQYTVRIISKSKKIKWVKIYARLIDCGGKAADLVFINDITHQKIAEEELKKSQEKLREQNIELKKLDQLKNDFITIAAHELKTPLVSIMGYSELILANNELFSANIEEAAGKILRNSERLKFYINRLLDVMKLDSNKIDIVPAKADLSAIIEEVLHRFDYIFEKKEFKVEVDIPDDIEFQFDPLRIKQVVNNIVQNATKFTPKKGKISINAVKEERIVRVSISDTGIGIEQNDCERVFEKFVTLNSDLDEFSAQERGSGIGLYLARGIIHSHGGNIWIDSRGKGKGTKITFTLPLNGNKKNK